MFYNVFAEYYQAYPVLILDFFSSDQKFYSFLTWKIFSFPLLYKKSCEIRNKACL